MSTLIKVDTSAAIPFPVIRAPYLACVKGAPNIVLDNCTHMLVMNAAQDGYSVKALSPQDRADILKGTVSFPLFPPRRC